MLGKQSCKGSGQSQGQRKRQRKSMIWDTLVFYLDDMRYSYSGVKNLLTPKDNRLLSKQSDELAVKDSLALSIQCVTPNDQPLVPHLFGVLPSTEAPNDHPPVPPISGALPMTRGTIKLSGRELADVKKVLRVPKEDIHLGKLRPLFGKYGFQPLDSECQRRRSEQERGTSTKKGKTPMLVPVDDILFHKGTRKHRLRLTPRPKSQEEAIGCAATIVAGEERRLLPHLPTINLIFPLTIESTDQEGDPSSSSKRKYKEEVSSIYWKNLKDLKNLSLQPSSFRYVMIEYDDRLREVERYKAKFKENKHLVNDARKTSKALAKAIRLKDQTFESLKRQNVSKVKRELDNALVEVSGLKRSIPTERNAAVQEFLGSQAFYDAFRLHCIRAANFEKRKWIAVLERYDNGSIIRKYRDEMDEYRQRGKAFVFAVDPSSEDDSDNEASVGEQSRESEDGSGDVEDDGDGDRVETFKPERFSDRDVRELGLSCLNHIFIELMPNGLHYIGCRMAVAQHLYSLSLLFWTRNVSCSSSTRTIASVPKASENEVSPVEVRYEVRYDQRTWGTNFGQ
ncbi:GRIP domain-containing protein RUD3-like [Pyrus ussuriensis x Pyrus communis]|uniref:GRIP domain-containing protein RUD3-like n=1 Tax=Pyrus ussuriensis x Pyrus communis TaxID=2448454 RepID=A0A5N5HNT5_9ROSA|nr:GRIP domain-containing protein RUD3-like [Pyrus ussuriensis x Pyrus communis]